MMNNFLHNSIRALGLSSLVILCPVVTSAQGVDPPAATSPAAMPHGSMQPAAPGADASTKPMMDGMTHMPMDQDADKDFATMMKMHHQRAIDMAQSELKNGKSPAMKALATRIIAAQSKEIAQLDQWLAKQK